MKVVSASTYLKIYLLLLLLMALTLGASFVDLGAFHLVASLAIASSKALIIGLYFMHLHYSTTLVRVTAGAGVIWLLILLVLSMGDYVSRDWMPLPGDWPQNLIERGLRVPPGFPPEAR